MTPTIHFNVRPDSDRRTEARARRKSQPDRRGTGAAAPLVREDFPFESEETF